MHKKAVDQLLSRYPSSRLLRLFASEVLGEKFIFELPDDPVEPLVLANRIMQIANSVDLSFEVFSKLKEKENDFVQAEISQKINPRLLGSKYAFFAEACSQITRTDSFRATFVGPVFLLPQWMVERRNVQRHTPNFSVAVRRFFDSLGEQQYSNVRIIMRNSSTFIKEYEPMVQPNEKKKFINDMLIEAQKLWGNNGEKGPHLCCINPGYLYLPHIFDSAVLTATRANAKAPVDGGWLDSSLEVTEREKDRFDKVFDGAQQGQSSALKILQDCIKKYWA